MDFTTANNAQVVMPLAPFKDAMSLKNAIEKELKESGAQLDLKADISTLFLSVDSSDAVYKALMVCAGRGTYNHEKINEKTFETVEGREDYYEVMITCLKVNVAPFFKGLLLASQILKSFATLPKDSPASK